MCRKSRFNLCSHFPPTLSPVPIGARFFVSQGQLERVELCLDSSLWEAVQDNQNDRDLFTFCDTFLLPWCNSWMEGKEFAIPMRAGKTESLIRQGLLGVYSGETLSYSEFGNRLSVHPRAAGRLLSQNRLPLVIPCHRVLCKDGSIGGYRGGVELKKKLLMFEASMH